MMLSPLETSLLGRWVVRDGAVAGDTVCERIRSLTHGYLDKIAADASGWDTLFQDPNDGRYWELLYLQSELHGGGPPSLLVINADAARAKYGL